MTAARDPKRFYALKDADTFVVADSFGDIVGTGDGLFRNDTRVLSKFHLTINGAQPSLLSAATSRDNVLFKSNMTNQPLPELGGRSLPRGVIHIERTRFVWQQRMYERISCVNFGTEAAGVPLALTFAADFRDMFEVRGVQRSVRGRVLPAQIERERVTLDYEGLDGVHRSTALAFSQSPIELTGERACFDVQLAAASHSEIYLEVGPEQDIVPSRERFRAAAANARRAMRIRSRRGARLRSSGRLFNDWMEKSRADLALLTSELETGPYPYAGIPWFSVPFGRDAIITALQMLWLDASLARGVLRFLARNQAREQSSFQDAAPGKIMHETRKGEMTALRELPFGEYYGGVDTTPLFVMLAGAYADRTGDLTLIDELWAALQAACGWIESVADTHPDGFLSYARAAQTGLSNQGWKDSEDSIFHADGSFPQGPIALVEVQGYVFAAFSAMANLAERRETHDEARRWRERAERLRIAVEQRFWMPEACFYGVAIGGDGALCRVSASNAGHLLFTGLPSAERAEQVGHLLLSSAFDCGWGLRTLAPHQARFNPMSYHNGSVWPHDTGLCTAGLARYGERRGVTRLINEMFETAVNFGMQLPELFCGFARAPGEPPVAYPVACLPQAWAAGSIFIMLQACLGLRVDGWSGEVHVHRPELPHGIDR
ncbi:MAG TPA: amylo-alpha-1,6-glucosidase, partial [Spongiibacteraceae bacterium]|nr:amylo-alpha-1,6-glucosidase [Spongiibacteraceae bacterium]